jgi:hypothetical protein
MRMHFARFSHRPSAKRAADGVGTGGTEASVSLGLIGKKGLEHWHGSHLMKERLGSRGCKEGAAGAATEQSPRGSNHG